MQEDFINDPNPWLLCPGTGWCPTILSMHFGQWEGNICLNRVEIKKKNLLSLSRSPATFIKISLGQPNRGRDHRREAQPNPS